MTDGEFENIYKTYFDDIYRYILILSRNRHVAEDIASDTFFKAMCSIGGFRGACGIRSWLYQIARNSYYSYLRKNRKIKLVDELSAEISDGGIGIEEKLELRDASMRIGGILEKLDEPYRGVFMLRTVDGLSFQKIAGIYDKTDNWACVTYHRARKKIKSEMEEYR